ncbi:Gfo/Idh/MocA family oxidoreductase [Maribellus sp. YY47]|uniref:Gfo/Idh/MocA family oxidoreductase n=1 Tax=Maribellus sp. YY47 TaxID=2929486 RepID=UPI002000814E|nr:Gfo/Idh/MocA family oxidoreductase [Maribellus sp. YY47]MCK3686081.1 Gfo/Idh/MocA family oxidoreductase [Maribellus sp. YY47]
MKSAVKTALASYGMSGQVFHGPLLKVNPGFEVICIQERTKTLSKKLFPGASIVRSYAELLNHPEVELVVVNTPDHLHYSMAKAALEAGKHVVVEKPMTLRSEEAEKLITLAEKNKLMLTVFQNRRWDADFRTVQQVVKEAKFGRLVEFESHFDRYRTYVAPNTWKEEGDEYVGVLYNLGAHMVDQAVVLFGMPKAVTAHLRIVRKGGVVYDYYDIRLEYDGFAALLKCSYLVKDPGPRYTIHGELGTFYKWGIDPQEELLKAGHLPTGQDWGAEPPEEWGTLIYEENGEEIEMLVETVPGNYNLFYDNVFEAIRNKADLAVKPKEVAGVIRILEACLQSNREKCTVALL